MASATRTDDVDEIRRRMAQIRRELHDDVREMVVSAEVAFDWRHYIRQYPWAACAAALALGYLAVPKRRKVVVQAPEVRAEAPRTVEKKEKRAGLIGALFGFAGPLIMRAAQSYAAHYVENWIAQQGVQFPVGPFGLHPDAGPGPYPGAGPGRPGAPGGARRP